MATRAAFRTMFVSAAVGWPAESAQQLVNVDGMDTVDKLHKVTLLRAKDISKTVCLGDNPG